MFNPILTPVSAILENHPVSSAWGILCRHMLRSRLPLSLKQRGCNCHMGLSPLTPARFFSSPCGYFSTVCPGGMYSCHFEGKRKLSGQQHAVLLLQQLTPADCPFPPPFHTPSIAGNPEAFPGAPASSQPKPQGTSGKHGPAQETSSLVQCRECKCTLWALSRLAHSLCYRGGE